MSLRSCPMISTVSGALDDGWLSAVRTHVCAGLPTVYFAIRFAGMAPRNRRFGTFRPGPAPRVVSALYAGKFGKKNCDVFKALITSYGSQYSHGELSQECGIPSPWPTSWAANAVHMLFESNTTHARL